MKIFERLGVNNKRVLLSSSSVLACMVLAFSMPVLTIDISVLQIIILGLCVFLLMWFRWPAARFALIAGLTVLFSTHNLIQHGNNRLDAILEGINIEVQGSIEGLPETNAQRLRFRFRVESSSAQALSGKRLLLSCYRCPLDIQPDQAWQFTVRLKRPRGYASWGAFDYEKYLFRHRVAATGYLRLKQTNLKLADERGSIDSVRWRISQYLDSALPDMKTGRGLIKALAIGDKSLLSSEQKTLFQAAGVSHLIAISGLHIGLVFLVTLGFGKLLCYPFASIYNWVPRQQLFLFPGLLAALLYAALAGFAISTQRALIMLTVFVLCRLLARELSLRKVLLLSMVIILCYDPFSVLDVGFWLSCGAVLIIALAAERIERLSLLRLQPLICLGMLPITVLFFGQASLVSPLVNLIAVPLFCVLLIPLTLFAVLSAYLGAGAWADTVLRLLAHCYEWIVDLLQWCVSLGVSQWYPAGLDSVDYLLMAAVLCVFVMCSGLTRWHLALVTLLLVSLLYRVPDIKHGEVDIALLDVGQGLAMVVETQNTVTVYDTGPAYPSGFSAAKAVLIPYLRYRGVSRIDDLIISHADNDHIGGYGAVRKQFAIQRVLTSRTDKLPEADNCVAGQRWAYDGVSFEVLSPDRNTPPGSNNLSCVLKITAGEVEVLITGDIEKQVERYLLDSGQALHADIMLVPHQGSKTSSTSAFIERVRPSLGLIAAGYRNHYGHPHPSVVARYQARGVQLASTIQSGSILLKIKNNRWRQESFRIAHKRFWHD